MPVVVRSQSSTLSSRQIDSPQNPIIKATAKLRSRRGRQQTGLIIIDGVREIQRAVAAGLKLSQLFVPNDLPVDEAIIKGSEQVFQVSSRAHAKIAFGDRSELVATAERPTGSINDIQVTSTSPVVVVEAIEKPGNIGAIMRSADGAGAAGIVLVDPLADHFSPNAIRASLGTAFHVKVSTASFDEFKLWCSQSAITPLLAICDSDATRYDHINFDRRVAIVLGNEAHGLTDKWGRLSKTERLVVPMKGVADSLNVSVTAAILLYEATKHRQSR